MQTVKKLLGCYVLQLAKMESSETGGGFLKLAGCLERGLGVLTLNLITTFLLPWLGLSNLSTLGQVYSSNLVTGTFWSPIG